jgi:pimeloyl-ACP methyl ester carboxylesterase
VNEPSFFRLAIGNREIETALWRAETPVGTILLLHEALGSVSYWKDFPKKLGAVTGYDVIAYSRAGHGDSEGPVEPRSIEYYQKQVEVVLPALFEHFHVDAPVLYGHSEGAAIAFLYAAGKRSVQAVIAECPIVVQEAQTLQTIDTLESSYENSDMRRRLARYHLDADAVFHSWMRSNRSRLFTDYPIQQYLEQVDCPVLVLQGLRDEFGTLRQFEVLQQALPDARQVTFDAGHLLHREQPDLVAAHVKAFLSKAGPTHGDSDVREDKVEID